MRPGLVFIGLFLVLMAFYFLLRDSIGATWTFVLQAALVMVLLGGAVWYRFAKQRSGWFFFRTDNEEPDELAQDDKPAPKSKADSTDDSADDIRKAS